MADEKIRELVREAGTGDALALGRACRELARVGRFDEAEALLAQFDPVDPLVLDEVALASVDELELRAVASSYDLKKLSHVAWAPDGRTLYAADDQTAIVAFDESTGERRDVARLERCVKAMAVDASGERLAFIASRTRSEKGPNDDLQLVDLERGWVGPVMETNLALVSQVTFVRGKPDKFLVSGRGSGEKQNGHWITALDICDRDYLNDLWRETAPLIALHRGGYVSVKRGKIGFHPWKGETALFPIDEKIGDGDRLAGAGERAVVVGGHLTLISSSGEVLARSSSGRARHWYAKECWREVVASPSGRQLAAIDKTNALTLVDVATGHIVKRALDARPRRPAWSPSGRKLAVPLDSGAIVLLSSGSVSKRKETAAPAPEWVELRKDRREWCGRVQGSSIELRWCTHGRRASTKTVDCSSVDEARLELDRRVRVKRAEGWTSAPSRRT